MSHSSLSLCKQQTTSQTLSSDRHPTWAPQCPAEAAWKGPHIQTRTICILLSFLLSFSFQFYCSSSCLRCRGITKGLVIPFSAFREVTLGKVKNWLWHNSGEVAQCWKVPLYLCFLIFGPDATVAELVTWIFCWWLSKDVPQLEHTSCYSRMCITSKPHRKCRVHFKGGSANTTSVSWKEMKYQAWDPKWPLKG